MDPLDHRCRSAPDRQHPDRQQPDREQFVAQSELRVDALHAAELIAGFRDRLRLVDSRPEFERLEVWQDQTDQGLFSMVSWWSSREAFVEYMRSDDHRRSHARIPSGLARPRPLRLSRFDIVAR
jgi:heme-degrading monooxygenase HmoA